MSTKLIETVLELLSEKVKNIESENQKLREQVVTLTERIDELEGMMKKAVQPAEEIEEERLTRAEARESAIAKILAVVAPGTAVRVGTRKEGSGIVIVPDGGDIIKVKYTLNRKSSGTTQWTSLEKESLDEFEYFIFTSQVEDQVIDLVFTKEQVMTMGREERNTSQFIRFSFTFGFEGNELVKVVENAHKDMNLLDCVSGYQLF